MPGGVRGNGGDPVTYSMLKLIYTNKYHPPTLNCMEFTFLSGYDLHGYLKKKT